MYCTVVTGDERRTRCLAEIGIGWVGIYGVLYGVCMELYGFVWSLGFGAYSYCPVQLL